jgi:hypothetical protein
MGKISNELDKLVAILEEQQVLFLKRADLMKRGELGKVRFLDENIFPFLEQKQNKQAIEVTKAFRQREGDEHEVFVCFKQLNHMSVLNTDTIRDLTKDAPLNSIVMFNEGDE